MDKEWQFWESPIAHRFRTDLPKTIRGQTDHCSVCHEHWQRNSPISRVTHEVQIRPKHSTTYCNLDCFKVTMLCLYPQKNTYWTPVWPFIAKRLSVSFLQFFVHLSNAFVSWRRIPAFWSKSAPLYGHPSTSLDGIRTLGGTINRSMNVLLQFIDLPALPLPARSSTKEFFHQSSFHLIKVCFMHVLLQFIDKVVAWLMLHYPKSGTWSLCFSQVLKNTIHRSSISSIT